MQSAIVPLVVPTYAPHLFADVELLSFLAVEGYHQAFLPQSVSAEEHGERLRRVVEAVPEDLREWVQGALAGRTSKSASRKLAEVMSRAGGTGEALEAALPRFRNRALATRHRVAHPRDYESGNGAEMFFIAHGLRWAVRHCLLLELGFDESEATRLVADCQQFKNDVELLKRHGLMTRRTSELS